MKSVLIMISMVISPQHFTLFKTITIFELWWALYCTDISTGFYKLTLVLVQHPVIVERAVARNCVLKQEARTECLSIHLLKSGPFWNFILFVCL